jgi:tRNA-2-methylthio-N6-dimethylallyladenosine synthase
MTKYYIWTIGCQMNKAESERIASLFEKDGLNPATRAEEADFIVVNTCVVRKHAEDRVTNRLYALKSFKKSNPDVKLAVTGCFVDSSINRLKNDYPHIDYFFKAGECPPWQKPDKWQQSLPEHPQVATYVPIIQGCNNFCTYCIVPYRRGREKSRPVSEVVCEVQELVKRGTREVTLLGQNVDSYGHDLPDKPELADLLEELNEIDGLWRIRFLTNHPKDISQRLIEAVARLDKVCPALNIPSQAGSNEVLKLMRRGYTIEQYRDLINRIRDKIPDVALSNDIIVGFPSETEVQFQESVNLLTELKFDTIHIAAYSPRPGTLAARKYIDDIPDVEKKRRVQALEKLQEGIATEINEQSLGKAIEVLVEGKRRGKWYGRTITDKIVFFSSDNDWHGKIAILDIGCASPWSLQGKLRQ